MTTVGQWMKHPVHVIKPLDSVAHAREVMEQHRVNQLPVVVNNRLVGIVTDRDLRDATPSMAETVPALDPGATARITVESVMTPAVLTVTPIDPLQRAAAIMRRERIGALPVLHDGRLAGIITRSDILEAFSAGIDRVAASL